MAWPWILKSPTYELHSLFHIQKFLRKLLLISTYSTVHCKYKWSHHAQQCLIWMPTQGVNCTAHYKFLISHTQYRQCIAKNKILDFNRMKVFTFCIHIYYFNLLHLWLSMRVKWGSLHIEFNACLAPEEHYIQFSISCPNQVIILFISSGISIKYVQSCETSGLQFSSTISQSKKLRTISRKALNIWKQSHWSLVCMYMHLKKRWVSSSAPWSSTIKYEVTFCQSLYFKAIANYFETMLIFHTTCMTEFCSFSQDHTSLLVHSMYLCLQLVIYDKSHSNTSHMSFKNINWKFKVYISEF